MLYYNKAVSEKTSMCKNDLKSTITAVEMHIMKAQIEDKKYKFNPSYYKLNVGIFDLQKRAISSNLLYSKIDFKKMMDMQPKYVHLIKKLPHPIQNVSYIVAEDLRMPQEFSNLKLLIAMTIFASMIFIAFIGYLLSKLLLKPVKEHIAQLDKFIKDSTHEINTPVTALLMSVSQLKKPNSNKEKLLRHISISSKLIANTYNTLSHISFKNLEHEEEIKLFDLKKEIFKSIAFFKEIAQSKKITIHDDLDSTYIQMNQQDAAKLINNLLSNAIKYSHPKSKIFVILKDNILSVKDQGIGISKEDQKEIFKRYKRASELGGGFGIGLDIVSSICKKHELSLTIKSKPNQGSTFSIDFNNLTHK